MNLFWKLALQGIILTIGTIVTLVLGFSFILWSVLGWWCSVPMILGFVAAYVTIELFEKVERVSDDWEGYTLT